MPGPGPYNRRPKRTGKRIEKWAKKAHLKPIKHRKYMEKKARPLIGLSRSRAASNGIRGNGAYVPLPMKPRPKRPKRGGRPKMNQKQQRLDWKNSGPSKPTYYPAKNSGGRKNMRIQSLARKVMRKKMNV